jgi:hypothetical protein
LKNDGKQQLPNRNYDTGKKSRQGEYELADDAYNKLLVKLKKKNFATADASLKKALADFYSGGNNSEESKKVKEALAELKAP